MSLGTWDPSAAAEPSLDAAALSTLLAAAESDADNFGLSPSDVQSLAPLARDGSVWKAAATDLEDAQLVSLVRLFTVAEGRFDAWKADAKSPVIALAAELRRRGSYPEELTAWIKANSSNRFLPWGSLLDRL